MQSESIKNKNIIVFVYDMVSYVGNTKEFTD